MNVLIVVASKHGSTREIAEVIAADLRAESLSVDVCATGAVVDMSGYDAVVLGSGIYAGSWLPEAKRFAEQHRATLGALPVWVFSSGPIGADEPQPHNDPLLLAASLGDTPIRDHRIFAGNLDRQNLGFGERLIARVVGAPEGDFRDWAAIRAWAREIGATLTTADAGSPNVTR